MDRGTTIAVMTTDRSDPMRPAEDGPLPAHRLRRRTADRVVGGVAGGLADYLNVDPLLVRVAFAGLMVFGGAGLVLYVAGWLLVPADGRDDSIVQAAFDWLSARVGSRGMAVLVIAGVILLVVWLLSLSQPCYMSLDDPNTVYCSSIGVSWPFDGEPASLRLLVLALAVMVAGIAVLRRRDGSRSRIAPTPSAPAASRAMDPDAAAGVATTTWEPGSAVAGPKAAPRPPSPLGWFVLAAAFVAVGLLAIAGNMPGLRVAPGQYLGAAILVLGIGLVVGAWWGRARLLILLGVLVLPVAATAAFVTVPLDGGVADQTFQPQSAGELRPDYRLAGGDLRLDLGQLPAGDGPVVIDASVGIGRLTVLVPADARLALDARVNGGRLSLFGNRQVGTGLADRIERTDGSGPNLVLHLETGLGEIVVEQDTAGD
jgi:phage shock protein PspC (stress-responsive transcriptional regulator)